VNLAYTDIVSPINGVVVSRSVDVGQTVAASLQAPILFTIAEDLHKMQVDTSVAEADIGRLQSGMKATFTVDAYPSDRFEGTVRQIRHAPQNVQNVVTYDAVIDVDNKELKLQPGMTANCTFVYAERDDVLNVPNAALRFRPPPELMAELRKQGGAPAEEWRRPGSGGGGAGADGGHSGRRQGGASNEPPDRRTVWVLRDERPTPVHVRIGISDGTRTEIVEGELKPGDQVITDASSDTPSSAPGMGPGGGFRRVF
jgi:HlyD family secretion protein